MSRRRCKSASEAGGAATSTDTGVRLGDGTSPSKDPAEIAASPRGPDHSDSCGPSHRARRNFGRSAQRAPAAEHLTAHFGGVLPSNAGATRRVVSGRFGRAFFHHRCGQITRIRRSEAETKEGSTPSVAGAGRPPRIAANSIALSCAMTRRNGQDGYMVRPGATGPQNRLQHRSSICWGIT